MTIAAASQAPPPYFFVWFPLVFIGGWVLVSAIISGMGWGGLAERYPARVRPEGRAYNVPGVQFGMLLGGYRNVVRIIFTQEGMYFCVSAPFRMFHPPFLLPWEGVERVVEKKGFLRGRYYELILAKMGGEIGLRLSKAAEQELLRCLPEGLLQQRVGG